MQPGVYTVNLQKKLFCAKMHPFLAHLTMTHLTTLNEHYSGCEKDNWASDLNDLYLTGGPANSMQPHFQ